MIAIAVDDEKIMLNALEKAVNKSPEISEVKAFSVGQEALEWVRENPVDIAFLDISLRGMTGLSLGEKILELRPACKIVFCTGYSEYAVDAFKLHASGYLLKPVDEQSVQREIEHIKSISFKDKKLLVKCFGNFEALVEGRPLGFKRSKTKELMAYLIDRKGAGVTTKQICAVLWENSVDDTKSRNHLYQIINDLKNTIAEVGVEDILIKNSTTYAIDVDKVSCDYYDFLAKGKPEFYGEYMSQYSWAENTCGLLLQMRKNREL